MVNKKTKHIKQKRVSSLKGFFETGGIKSLPDYSSVIESYRSRSRLKSSHYFYDQILAHRKSIFQRNKERPVIGYFCNLVPEEIIRAFDAVPMRLCRADDVCAQTGEEIVSGDICPVIKSIAGAAYSREYDNLDLIVVPAACDGKMKLAEILTPVNQIYFLDLPRETDYLKNAEIWAQKYNDLYQFLQKRLNCQITRRELLKACEVSNKRTNIFRKIYSLRAENPQIINSFDYFVMAYASFFAEPSDWIAHAEEMYLEAFQLKDKDTPVFEGKRVLLSGAPVMFPSFKILEIMEESGADVSADTMCSAYGSLYDPVEIDEETESGILRALSLKYIAASICPCFLGIDKLIDYIIDTVKEYSLDGVIYYNLRLCQIFELQTGIIRHILKEDDIPFLSIKTDLGREDTGQLKTRIEAFLEVLGKMPSYR